MYQESCMMSEQAVAAATSAGGEPSVPGDGGGEERREREKVLQIFAGVQAAFSEENERRDVRIPSLEAIL